MMNPTRSATEQKTVTTLLASRSTTGRYDPEKALAPETVRELVRLASFSPSAFNLQNWYFVAVQSPESKEKLSALAYGQPQIKAAAVTYIVCGQLEGYLELAKTLQPSVDRQIISPAIQQSWVETVTSMHENDRQLQRDEAIRSASLSAMSLIIAAEGLGLASGAVGGFDADGIVAEFGLSAQDIPVLLVTVGYASEGNWPQKVRKPVEAILDIC